MGSFVFISVEVGGERLDKFALAAISRVLLLKESLKLIIGFFWGIFLDVDGVLEDLRVVHRAPTDKTAMVGKGWELVLLYVAMHSLLDVKVLAHTKNYNFE
jgi:hypothetical protein